MNAIYSVIIATLVASTKARDVQIDWFDCSSRPDGNHAHPTDCTRYIACSAGVAYDRGCDICHVDPVRCPDGYMIYNSTYETCMWANETKCEVGTVDPTTENSSSESTENSIPTPPPVEGSACDPEECRNVGYCQNYLKCDKEAGKWVREECGENLVWNPLNPNGTVQIHGGNCDIWDNLSSEVERQYRTDPSCLGCFWRALDDCSQDYDYQPCNGTHRNVLRLSCSEGLIFSQETETCELCHDVRRKNGNNCCL